MSLSKCIATNIRSQFKQCDKEKLKQMQKMKVRILKFLITLRMIKTNAQIANAIEILKLRL